MKIYHIERDYNKPLSQQKKELAKEYTNFNYLYTYSHIVTFIAD